MVKVFSERKTELYEIIKPYLKVNMETFKLEIDKNANENIKNAFEEWKVIE